MEHWCKKLTSLQRNPPCDRCESKLCYVRKFRKIRRVARKHRELRKIARMVGGEKERKKSKLKVLDFLIGFAFLPGLVMLIWIPFIFALASSPVPMTSQIFVISILICLLISTGIHELGHVIIARSKNVTIKGWKLVPIGIGFRMSENVSTSASLEIFAAGPIANLITASVAGLFWQNPLAFTLLISSLFLFLINGLPHRRADGLKVGLTLADASDVYTYLYASSFFLFVPFSLLLVLWLF